MRVNRRPCRWCEASDTFVFARSQASSVPAVIADFQDGIDKIDMRTPFGGTPMDFNSRTITQTGRYHVGACGYVRWPHRYQAPRPSQSDRERFPSCLIDEGCAWLRSTLASHDVGAVVVALRCVVFSGKNVEACGTDMLAEVRRPKDACIGWLCRSRASRAKQTG